VLVELFRELAKTQKNIGKNIIIPRQEHPITRQKNFFTANNVSLMVTGLPIEKQNARYGTAMKLTNDNVMVTKPAISKRSDQDRLFSCSICGG
jgi:hypothetical protein